MVSIEKVKELRGETGISVMECKKALEGAEGDMDEAREILKNRKSEMAAKKKDREVGEGLITSYVHSDGKKGVLLDMRSETDFVSGSDGFKELGKEVALQIVAMNPENVEELMEQEFIKNEKKTITDMIDAAVAKFGENIEIRRFTRFEI